VSKSSFSPIRRALIFRTGFEPIIIAVNQRVAGSSPASGAEFLTLCYAGVKIIQNFLMKAASKLMRLFLYLCLSHILATLITSAFHFYC